MTSGLERWRPGRGEWDRGAAAHLLSRAGLGPAPGEVERALAEGVDATVDRLVSAREPDPRLRASAGALLATGSFDSLRAWWVALLASGRAPLVERATLLWHDRFATSEAKVDDARLMHRQNELFREKGLGDFRELVHAVATDPAMLLWLDGDENRRGSPNENFARELMELFCLGRGAYGERDVAEAARAFTGWGTEGRRFARRAEHHDGGVKEILGRRGRFTGEEAIDVVLAHDACPRHVARGLLAELVRPRPGAAAVEALAGVLLDESWNVGRAIERVLRSELFFSPRARRSRVAAPVELLVATVRRLGSDVAPARLARAASAAGQTLFRPPSVNGWDGGRSWLGAGAWIARHEALADLAEELADPRAPFPEARSVAAVPDAVCAALLPDGTTSAYRSELARAVRGRDVGEALRLAASLVLTSPEYHLC